MARLDFLSLTVQGHGGGLLPNRFLKQAGEAHALTVILPGLNYSCDSPFLHYITALLAERSTDVLQLWANYTIPQFQSLSREGQLSWLLEDASPLIGAARQQRDYDHLILVGKSIGTLTMGALFGQLEAMRKADTLWLTPLLHHPVVVEGALQVQGKAMFLAGGADRTFDARAMERIRVRTGARVLVLDGADHGLEIPDAVMRSLDALQKAIHSIEIFLDSEIFAR